MIRLSICLANIVRKAHISEAHISGSAAITNSIHAVFFALATATVGAIFPSTAPDIGASGILDRYRRVTSTVLFAATEVTYAKPN